jgi:hypothetical protein
VQRELQTTEERDQGKLQKVERSLMFMDWHNQQFPSKSKWHSSQRLKSLP